MKVERVRDGWVRAGCCRDDSLDKKRLEMNGEVGKHGRRRTGKERRV